MVYACCFEGHLEVAQFLVSAGLSINLANEEGFSPLYVAAQNNHIAIVKWLISNKADANQTTLVEDNIFPVFTLKLLCVRKASVLLLLWLRAGTLRCFEFCLKQKPTPTMQEQ